MLGRGRHVLLFCILSDSEKWSVVKTKYIMITRMIRNALVKCHDLSDVGTSMLVGDENAKIMSLPYIQQDLLEIKRLWPLDCDGSALSEALTLVDQTEVNVYTLIATVREIGDAIDDYYDGVQLGDMRDTLLELMHPVVVESSYMLFSDGNYRESVLSGVMSLFDLVRAKARLDRDGTELVNEAFSPNNPVIRVAETETETGKNIQKGVMLMLQGLYSGVRNPIAHSLTIDVDKRTAAQYLSFISMLAYKVDSGTVASAETA